MSLKIRLTRAGAKKRPYYRIVVADCRSPARRPLHREGRVVRSDEAEGRSGPRHPRDREGAGLARQGRAADRPGAALSRRRRPHEAHAPQQPAEGGARQEGEGARRRPRRPLRARRRKVARPLKLRMARRGQLPLSLPACGERALRRGGEASGAQARVGAETAPIRLARPLTRPRLQARRRPLPAQRGEAGSCCSASSGGRTGSRARCA